MATLGFHLPGDFFKKDFKEQLREKADTIVKEEIQKAYQLDNPSLDIEDGEVYFEFNNEVLSRLWSMKLFDEEEFQNWYLLSGWNISLYDDDTFVVTGKNEKEEFFS